MTTISINLCGLCGQQWEHSHLCPGRNLGGEVVALGPYLFQFDSFAGWVNHAQRAWKMAGVRSDDTLCIDAAGRICRIGRDFMLARDQQQFPVRVYMMRGDLPAPTAQKGAQP